MTYHKDQSEEYLCFYLCFLCLYLSVSLSLSFYYLLPLKQTLKVKGNKTERQNLDLICVSRFYANLNFAALVRNIPLSMVCLYVVRKCSFGINSVIIRNSSMVIDKSISYPYSQAVMLKDDAIMKILMSFSVL